MCGIAGTYRPDPADGGPDEATARTMAGLIAHRGPDAEGFLIDGPVALASRRLAIIDLSAAGRQPLFNEDGSVGIVYNGELYNFQDLRRELVSRGHRFRSATDTEVIVHAYEEFGPDCVRRFNGMFAFAIWDRRRATLFLARDRFGVKPLYYARVDGVLAVASEIKAFFALPGFRVDVDPEALVEYFTFQNILSDRTLFRGVRLLPPGATLTVRPDGTTAIERYWQFQFAPGADRGEAYYVSGVRERFEEAVRRQLMSDVPVGSYLSGGMDSGAICAVASRQIPHLHTFTGGFDTAGVAGDEALSDERAAAESMAVAMGTEHYQMLVQPGDMPRVMPRPDLAPRGPARRVELPQLLRGPAGQPFRQGGARRRRRRRAVRRLPLALPPRLGGHRPGRLRAALRRLLVDPASGRRPAGLLRRVARRRRPRLLGNGGGRRRDGRRRPESPLDLALTFEARSYLQGLFVVEDRLSMAHSLESRVPFLDNDLVDFACAIPAHHKVGGGSSKRVLRAAMRGLIPDHILSARKQGFAPPEDAWYRGPALPYLRQVILSPRAQERGYFRPEALEGVFAEHVAGARNHKKLLWSLLCFEWWNCVFVDGERPAQLK